MRGDTVKNTIVISTLGVLLGCSNYMVNPIQDPGPPPEDTDDPLDTDDPVDTDEPVDTG